MSQKLKSILLVDDEPSTNFIHQMVIQESELTDTVYVRENGQEALDFLTTKIEGKFPCPDLILLDINMPVMDGWEFLESYRNLDEQCKSRMVIIMLTTSINPDDKDRAAQYGDIDDFLHKPLTVEMLFKVVEEHFSDPEKISLDL